MLTNNKTYDNSNLRDHEKSFNDGYAVFHKADGRILGEAFATYNFCIEAISYKSYLLAQQNARESVCAIGIPSGGAQIEHGDVAVLNGSSDYWIVDHVEYQDYARPTWYKVYMNRSTLTYETV